MPFFALLFAPRGAIGRGPFWLGLFLLLGLEIGGFLAFGRHGAAPMAAIPLVGPWLVDVSGPALGFDGWIPGLAILALQGWVSGVLCLKRLRDMGHGAGPLVGVWGLDLILTGGLMAWMGHLQGMAVIVPIFTGAGASGVLWLALLGWLGVEPGPRRAGAEPAPTFTPAPTPAAG